MTDSLDLLMCQESEEGIKNYASESNHFKRIVPD